MPNYMCTLCRLGLFSAWPDHCCVPCVLPQFEELAGFAARIQGLLLTAWEKSTCLREIMVETVVARQVEVRLYVKVIELAHGELA